MLSRPGDSSQVVSRRSAHLGSLASLISSYALEKLINFSSSPRSASRKTQVWKMPRDAHSLPPASGVQTESPAGRGNSPTNSSRSRWWGRRALAPISILATFCVWHLKLKELDTSSCSFQASEIHALGCCSQKHHHEHHGALCSQNALNSFRSASLLVPRLLSPLSSKFLCGESHAALYMKNSCRGWRTFRNWCNIQSWGWVYWRLSRASHMANK